jgi:hypothetical protein
MLEVKFILNFSLTADSGWFCSLGLDDRLKRLFTIKEKYVLKCYMGLVGKPEGNGPLGRFRHRCDYVTVDLKLIGRDNMDWIHMAHDRTNGGLSLHVVMNFWVGFYEMWGIG